ncbi:kinase [Rheinheimera riviphila]|uniref:Kinase n=2 Tax=Rheinheimera riviphila TaxID=1834037 RepID=A0A437R2J4_9GAMM|nr:kinase [Rheinheimera riviphila]
MFVTGLWQTLSKEYQEPAVIGISGAQGSGKTTLSTLLVQFAQEQGVIAGAVSLDDYYLSQQQRAVLAAKVHPLLVMRGVPGSHHIAQAIADAQAVRNGQPVALPRFDKALDQPIAARAPQQFSLLIIEGWCLGLTAQSTADLQQAVNQLEQSEDQSFSWRHFVNQQLAGQYQQYWSLLSSLIWLKAPDWPTICRWRALQEHQLRQQCGKGMNDIELERFMQTFQRLTEHSFLVLPQRADLVVELDAFHQPQLL